MIEFLYNTKKRIVKAYHDYFTVDGTYTSLLPDKVYLKKLYKKRMGKELNLKNPETFNEKLQWLKLYDRNPEYTTMVDKWAARDYLKEKVERKGYECSSIGLNFIPVLGVWNKVEEIDFDSLPNQFVLKCNHDNGVIICKDKEMFDIETAKKNLEYHYNRNYYKKCREWPYKNINRKIICEQYMEVKNNDRLVDYKFFCFDGIPKCLYVTQHINGKEYINYFDSDFQPLDIQRLDLDSLPFDSISRPICFDEMKKIAHELSTGLRWVRCDLYQIETKVYFGEMTFFPTGGFVPYVSEEWNLRFGEWINLSKKKRR